MMVINEHLEMFQNRGGKEDKWEQFARDVWRVGSVLKQ